MTGGHPRLGVSDRESLTPMTPGWHWEDAIAKVVFVKLKILHITDKKGHIASTKLSFKVGMAVIKNKGSSDGNQYKEVFLHRGGSRSFNKGAA